MKKPKVGLIFALPLEAKATLGRRNWRSAGGRMAYSTPEILGVCAGMGATRAFSAAQWLIEQGVATLGIIGVAGGLCPNLLPGDLVVADTVLEIDADLPRATWAPDPRCARELYRLLVGAGISVRLGRVLTTVSPASTREEKRDWYQKSRALTVDLESAAVIRAANQADVPSFVLRAVCDRAVRTLPPAIVHGVAENGRVQVGFLLQHILSNPSTLGVLWQVKNEFNAALAALGRGWRAQSRGELLSRLCADDQRVLPGAHRVLAEVPDQDQGPEPSGTGARGV